MIFKYSPKCLNKFGLHIWANDNFIEENGLLRLNYKSMPSLFEITQKVRLNGGTGPILLRFPHLIKKQIDNLYNNFNRAIKVNNYKD